MRTRSILTLHELIEDGILWQWPLGRVLLRKIPHELWNPQICDPANDKVQQDNGPLRIRHDDRPSPRGDGLDLIDERPQLLVVVAECQVEVVGMRDDLPCQNIGTGEGTGCP